MNKMNIFFKIPFNKTVVFFSNLNGLLFTGSSQNIVAEASYFAGQNCNLKIKSSRISKLIFAFLIFGFCLSVLSISQVSAQAQNTDLEYTLLAPLPCVDGDGTGVNFNPNCNKPAQKTTLEKYLPGMFQLLIGIAAAFAVFMIVIGGFQYMTTDAVQGKSEGKERITNAIYGLLLVISAWLILYTINPKLLELRLDIAPTDIKPVAGGGGTLSSPESLLNLAFKVKSTCPTCIISPTAVFQLTPENIARLNCPTCVQISAGIPKGNNMNPNITPGVNTSLEKLKTSNGSLTWYVSEAWPPVVNHRDNCHYVGTCVDASLGRIEPSATNASNVNTFYTNSSSAGFRPVFEVAPGQKSSWVNSGVNPDYIIEVSGVTPHFSLYK